LREIKHDYFAFVSLILLAAILLAIFIGAPVINARHDVMRVCPQILPVSPRDSATLFGLDSMGRNQLHLLIVAARNSLYLAFGVTFFSFLLGLTVGVFSGYYGGRFDNIVMRITDTWAMIPFIMVVIVLIGVFGRTVFNFILFLTLFTWVSRARLLRAAALAERQKDYINASKTLGTPNITIIFRELLPNLVDVTVANFVLTLAANIGIETGLSLLGFGLGWDYPSLGVMLQNATNPMYLQYFWWTWTPPLILVIILMLCVNFIGNALQRIADPKQRSC
jgi:peptide/nickel transport system permease protein